MTDFTSLDAELVALFDGRAVFWVAVLVALGVGAAHAVAPGHGKSITAAYLVGVRGRYRDALRLGVIVAIMHTLSVLLLASAWVGVTGAAGFATERVTAWLQVAAGVVVIGVGAHLVHRHLRTRRRRRVPHGHGHGHDGHDHDHDHDGHGHGHHHHHHGHDHSHDIPDASPWSRRGLTAIAVSGGLLPSPSAFLVLVSGMLTGCSLNAVVLVLMFGVGMAVTLTAVGVLTVRGHALLSRRAGGTRFAATLAGWTPAVAGVAVTVGGCLYLAAAVSVLAG
ncbi:HoxN/HupN/NixA family nickel/cobalt transporter [Streptomyces carpaticus]|uniref:Nickel/cobalt efflux system n=1 Tax=Streptomyces carpaticus TaxID=285558 RepID=A0ABV4ZK38_9ACTN